MSCEQKKIIITVDTEALFARASCNHVARLIYGDFGTGENYGIMEMMHLANKYDAKLVFFLDVAEIENYGKDVMREIVSDIYENGHDVQIHFHVNALPVEWTSKNKIKRKMLDRASHDDVMALFRYIEEVSEQLGIKNKIAFRAGAWRYNEYVISAMQKFGYKMSFHYNPTTNKQKNRGNRKPIFRHPNGMLEIPVSSHMQEGILHPYHIAGTCADISDSTEEVLVMVLHSWSLLSFNPTNGHLEPCGRSKYDNLEKFFKLVKENSSKYKTVDSSELYNEIKNNDYSVEHVLPLQEYIQFDYQNLENERDRKTVMRELHTIDDRFPIKVVGRPIYSDDRKRITLPVQDATNKITQLALVNNKANAAHISNLQLVEDKPGLMQPRSEAIGISSAS